MWSQRFRAELFASAIRPQYILEGFRVNTGTTEPTIAWSIGSQAISGSQFAPLMREGSRVGGTELTPRTWTAQIGTASFAVASSPSTLMGAGAVRGQLVRLRVGFPGWAPNAYESVWLGVLQNIHDMGTRCIVECRDFLSYLQNRKTTGANLRLFAGLGSSTTITSHTAGSGVVTVASTAGFGRQDDGSGTLKGAIRITHGSTPFYLDWTATTATIFTSGTTGLLGTTDVTASGGDAVDEMAYLNHHPIDSLRRVLVSTGTALAHGPYDTLPLSWGFGLPDGLIDHADCDFFKGKSSPASGAATWDVIVDAVQDDGLSWLQGVYSPGGFFPCVHQGQISVRAVLNPNTTLTPNSSVQEITDDDIIGTQDASAELWSADCEIEYVQHIVDTAAVTGTVVSTESSTSYPATGSYTTTLPYVGTNQSAWRTSIDGRLAVWYQRIPERRQVTLRGLQWACYAPGDVAILSSRLWSGRSERTRHGYLRRRVVVLGVEPDWFCASGPQTRMVLAIVPETA